MMTNLSRPNTAELLADIFRPPVFSVDLLTSVLDRVEEHPSLRSTVLRSQQWLRRSDFSDWIRSELLHQHTFWCLSSQFAKQAMLLVLQTWCESPTDSSHIFVIPRVMQWDFGRIAKYISYVGQSWDLPASVYPTVPLMIFYLPPYNHQLTFDLLCAR